MTTEPITRYRVIAKCVTVKTGAGAGAFQTNQLGILLYENALLPPDVSQQDVDRLLRKGMVEEVVANA